MAAADAMLGGADIATIEEILAGSDEYYNRAIT
jgi:hypothetical protein